MKSNSNETLPAMFKTDDDERLAPTNGGDVGSRAPLVVVLFPCGCS